MILYDVKCICKVRQDKQNNKETEKNIVFKNTIFFSYNHPQMVFSLYFLSFSPTVYLPLYFLILPAGGRLGFGNSLHEVHQFLHQQSTENNNSQCNVSVIRVCFFPEMTQKCTLKQVGFRSLAFSFYKTMIQIRNC